MNPNNYAGYQLMQYQIQIKLICKHRQENFTNNDLNLNFSSLEDLKKEETWLLRYPIISKIGIFNFLIF